jgi:hypothetical protein
MCSQPSLPTHAWNNNHEQNSARYHKVPIGTGRKLTELTSVKVPSPGPERVVEFPRSIPNSLTAAPSILAENLATLICKKKSLFDCNFIPIRK